MGGLHGEPGLVDRRGGLGGRCGLGGGVGFAVAAGALGWGCLQWLGRGPLLRKVGLVEYPAPGMWSIVLYSQPPGTDIKKRLPGDDEYLSVFLPCAPNPTTGFFFYVARKSVIELDINPEEAATLVMSAGMIQPGSGAQKKLADMAERAKATAAEG